MLLHHQPDRIRRIAKVVSRGAPGPPVARPANLLTGMIGGESMPDMRSLASTESGLDIRSEGGGGDFRMGAKEAARSCRITRAFTGS